MALRILKTEQDRERWVSFLNAQALPMTVSHAKGANRTKQQNATLHKWFGQIASEQGDSAAAIKAELKLRFGLPIMQANHPGWVEEWSPLYEPLPYAMRLKVFEIIPMTSLMRVKEMSEFMEAIQRECRTLGISLIDPEARKYEAEFA